MEQVHFVDENSIVREIWGRTHTILFIFAGASAEFALNKAVDWLYFTGKLPADPLGRLFSTVAYAQAIVFSDNASAIKAIDIIAAIHKGVEESRGTKIPDWAYKDVLFMLVDYSIRSFEVLERPMTDAEKQEVLNVFYRVGSRMGLQGLPAQYDAWKQARNEHLRTNLQYSKYTKDLFRQYDKHLGWVRYRVLLAAQALVLPKDVRELLGLRKNIWQQAMVLLFKTCKALHLDQAMIKTILPRNKGMIKTYL